CHLALSQSADSRDLHSFPTRRSSDLRRGRVYPFPSPLHHTALFGGRVTASPARSSSSAGQLVSRTEPGRRIVTGDDEKFTVQTRSEEHTSELQSRENLVCRLLLEKKK